MPELLFARVEACYQQAEAVELPITWEDGDVQYIGVTTGYCGAVPLWGGDMAELTKPVAQGGSFWVFRLP